jgi:hypothetical protein
MHGNMIGHSLRAAVKTEGIDAQCSCGVDYTVLGEPWPRGNESVRRIHRLHMDHTERLRRKGVYGR